MYNETLQSLGLTPNEAKIYKVLLELKNGSIWDVSTAANIDRRNTYDAMNRLVNRGLAFQILPKKSLTFAPAHPAKIREIVEDKMAEVDKILPGLVSRYNKVNSSQLAYIYKGVGGLKNYIDLELQVGKDIYGIASKGSWFDDRLVSAIAKAAKKYKKKGIASHIIYDERAAVKPEIIKAIGGEYKILPKKYASGSSVDIFGDYVAIYSGMGVKQLEEDITIVILKDKTLAVDFKKWWQFMWDSLPKPK